MRSVPDALYFTDTSETMEYIQGWNDCRAAMLAEQPVQQEPVAWMVYTQEGQSAFVTDNPAQIHPSQRALPLYATPQRPWVELTDEEFQGIYDHGRTPAGMMEMVEAKLREKNG